MSDLDQRVLALAGLVQALRQVRQIAESGQADHAVVGTALDSVFRIDAASPEAVYGGVEALEPGLRLLRDYFGNQGSDELLPRLSLAVMQLERRFVRESTRRARCIRESLRWRPRRNAWAAPTRTCLAALGSLYADTVSHLRPRVLVQGNPHYLGQAGVVAEIRAVLLAALRSAVLWRQLGGSLWDFLLRRRDMVAAIQSQLG